MKLIDSNIGKILCIILVFAMSSCAKPYNPLNDFEEVIPTTTIKVPHPDIALTTPVQLDLINQGKYLVELLGCASCHTDGALIGEADQSKRLAGSSVGIAYSNPLEGKHPGVVFPSNLTPDLETGLGSWSDIEMMRMVRSGVDRHGRNKLSVMPWPAYSIISDDDALAIISYLRRLSPVKHRVPKNVKPGEKTSAPYVHFGMYQKRH